MRGTAILSAVLLLAASARAEVKTKEVTYEHDGTKMKGVLAWDDAATGKRPGVLVVHEWWGLNDYARQRAEMLARMGYVAFAADMYGNGQVTEHPQEAGKMAGAVRQNVKTWMGRAEAALKVLQSSDLVDPSKLAAIGYCFGGSTALKLAFSGSPLSAVVSFHGALPVPSEDEAKAVKAKLLICHGANDSFIPEDVIQKFRSAIGKAGVDYQFVYYANAVHSFTVPDVEKKGVTGLRYDASADKRSWAAMQALFQEAFGK